MCLQANDPSSMFVENTGTDFEVTISDSDCSMISQSDSEGMSEIEMDVTRGEIYVNCFLRTKSIFEKTIHNRNSFSKHDFF